MLAAICIASVGCTSAPTTSALACGRPTTPIPGRPQCRQSSEQVPSRIERRDGNCSLVNEHYDICIVDGREECVFARDEVPVDCPAG